MTKRTQIGLMLLLPAFAVSLLLGMSATQDMAHARDDLQDVVRANAQVSNSGVSDLTPMLEAEIYLPAIWRADCVPSVAWETGTGLPGITVYALARDSGENYMLYAGTDGKGVHKSIDQGTSWQPAGLSDALIFGLAVDSTNNQTVYAATWGSGVQKTTKGGESWDPMNAGLEGHRWLYAIDIHPSRGLLLYVGTHDAGVYKTINGGISWTAVNSGLDSLNIRSLAVDPSNDQIVYVGTADRGVYKTSDGGVHWIPANQGLNDVKVWRILVDPTSVPPTSVPESRVVYAGTEGKGVYKSTDGGDTWTQMSEGLGEITVYGLAIDPRNSEVVYAGTDGSGVYRSADGGESWQVMSEGLGNLVVETLAIDSTLCPTLYAATKDGVWWYRPPKP